MIYSIGVADIDRIPLPLRSGQVWHIWFPEEADVSVDRPEWQWILQEQHRLMSNLQWPTYWLHLTAEYNQQAVSSAHPTKHFAVLVRKPRLHRVRLMQGLHKKGLLDLGIYSWLDHRPDWWIDREHSWKPPVVQLDNMQAEDDMWLQPPAVADTAISLAFETYDDKLFITEKTFIPILNSRMVLPYGAPGTVQTLKDWGFVFPKFFDFAYDQDLPTETRERLYVNTVQKIINLGTPERLYRMCLPYVRHNRQRVDSVIRDKVGVPVFENVPDWAVQMHIFMDRLR